MGFDPCLSESHVNFFKAPDFSTFLLLALKRPHLKIRFKHGCRTRTLRRRIVRSYEFFTLQQVKSMAKLGRRPKRRDRQGNAEDRGSSALCCIARSGNLYPFSLFVTRFPVCDPFCLDDPCYFMRLVLLVCAT